MTASLVSWARGELRRSLERSALLDGVPYEIFAQGSRANGTYLEQGSDIDLVLMLPGVPPSAWEGFRDDVLAGLGETHRVRMGRRCLNVDDPDSLFAEMVDVLVATEFTRGTERGVFFRDLEGRPIVNFPKQHKRNGDRKDLRTGGRFKESVRAVKRLKRSLGVDAPSYLLECLLYNVPDEVFLRDGSLGVSGAGAALGWLGRLWADEPGVFAGLPCQNGVNRLFGPGPDQWRPAEAGTIIDVLHDLAGPGAVAAA
jgi:hypothetical protein